MSQAHSLSPEQSAIPEQQPSPQVQELAEGAEAQVLAFPDLEPTQGQWNEYHAPNHISYSRQQFGRQFDPEKNLDSEIRNDRNADGSLGLPQKPENVSNEFALMGKRLESEEQDQRRRALKSLDDYMTKVDKLAANDKPQIFAKAELAKNAGHVVMQRTGLGR